MALTTPSSIAGTTWVQVQWTKTPASSTTPVNVYRSSTGEVTGSTLVGSSSNDHFVDQVEPGHTYSYWVQEVVDGVAGELIGPTTVKSGTQPAGFMQALGNVVTYDNLAPDMVAQLEYMMARIIDNEAALREQGDAAIYTHIQTENAEIITKVEGYKTQYENQNLLSEAQYNNSLTLISNEYQSLAQQVETFDARLNDEVANRSASVNTLTQALTDTSQSLAQQVTALEAKWDSDISTVEGKITQEAAVRAAEDGVTASLVNNLSTAFTTLESTTQAMYDDEVLARSSEHEALVQQMEAFKAGIVTDVAAVDAAITNETLVRVTAEEALAEEISTLEAKFDGELLLTNAAIVTESVTRANAEEALATTITELEASFNEGLETTNALITSEQTARANAISALAADVTTLTTAVGENSAAITTAAESIDGIQANYTIKTDINGRVAGIGLMSDANSTTFEIVADNFRVVDPDNPNTLVFGTDDTGTTIINAGKVYGQLESANYSTTTPGWQLTPGGGFTLRGANGAIVMQTSGVPYSSVLNGPPANANYTYNTNQLTDGAGLGTKAVWGSVTGTGKPENYATKGATFGSNINGQITASNASTYIARAAIDSVFIKDAAITTAKIGTAAVDTLQIAGQAVTIPVGNEQASSVSSGAVVSGSINSTGADIAIFFSCSLYIYSGDSGGGTAYVTITRGTTELYNSDTIMSVGNFKSQRTPFSTMVVDKPGAGTHTYTLNFHKSTGVDSSSATKGTVVLLEVKR